MSRPTKLEIVSGLLSGRTISWTEASGKLSSLQLSEPSQRRIFRFLLSSPVREAKDLPESFASGLAEAFDADDDPASNVDAPSQPSAVSGPWRLNRIETEGFGGLNIYGGPAFVLQLDGESLLLQGPNGSGKSSLVGAVLWAIAGDRPRDQSEAKPEARSEVRDQNDVKIGTWPSVACYPTDPVGLTENPTVRVTLTFIDPQGNTSTVERSLKDGSISHVVDPAFVVPDILIETGLLMPSRMQHLRLQKGQTKLTAAIQSLTGLDDLVEIGRLVEGLCHESREYRSKGAKDLAKHRENFDAALKEVQTHLLTTGLVLPNFEPAAVQATSGPLAIFGKSLRQKAAELTQVVSHDLAPELKLSDSLVQQELSAIILRAKEDLASGLETSPCWRSLSLLHSETSPEVETRILGAIATAQAEFREALGAEHAYIHDSRSRLKSLGARWHERHREGPVILCPLCDQDLGEVPDLKSQLESLRSSGESATRRLEDNLNAILANLNLLIPSAVSQGAEALRGLLPRQKLVEDLTARFLGNRYRASLTTFVKLFENGLEDAPAFELEEEPQESEEWGDLTLGANRTLHERVASLRRCLKLVEWYRANFGLWTEWWGAYAGREPEPRLDESQHQANETSHAAHVEDQAENLGVHLDRLMAAIGNARPYRLAAEALGRAWTAGKQAWLVEEERARRASIVTALLPLKALGTLAASQTRQALEDLSVQIRSTLERILIVEGLSFRGTLFDRRNGLVVQAGFDDTLRIDATLVANTSWLRAVLWSFLFALRSEAVQQLGANPLPLLILDDPQSTFDADHRHRWTKEIVGMQQDDPATQVILVTHDETFLELAKIDGAAGREAILASISADMRHVGFFEGASLERKWADTKKSNRAEAGREFIASVRTHVEGLLRLMLRGESPGVSAIGSGFVLGDSRDFISKLHKRGNAPWNKPEFSALVGQLGKGLAPVKYMEMAHHSSGMNLRLADAGAVEEHWRTKLQPHLDRAFALAREHQLLHGGLKALNAGEPSCVLPEGYPTKVASLELSVLGRAAALSEGRAADGRFELSLGSSVERVRLGRHFAYRLAASTMEPVARPGDILLVQELGEPSPRSLVVARCGDRVLARRFEISDNHSDVAVLTAQAVNPRRIAAPLVVKRNTLALHKVIGVLFEANWPPTAGDGHEVGDCGGEASLRQLTSTALGLVEVFGESAEPIALNGQFLLIGEPLDARDALARLEGLPVIASDDDDNRYFKRLRQANSSHVILESLEIGGAFPPVVLTLGAGKSTDLALVWPVLGVLFQRPD